MDHLETSHQPLFGCVGKRAPNLPTAWPRPQPPLLSMNTYLSSTLFPASLRDSGTQSHSLLAYLLIASRRALFVLGLYSERNIGCTVKSEGLKILLCFPLLCFSAIMSLDRDPLGFLHLSSKEGVQPSKVWRLLKNPACSTVIISRHLFLLKVCTFD